MVGGVFASGLEGGGLGQEGGEAAGENPVDAVGAGFAGEAMEGAGGAEALGGGGPGVGEARGKELVDVTAGGGVEVSGEDNRRGVRDVCEAFGNDFGAVEAGGGILATVGEVGVGKVEAAAGGFGFKQAPGDHAGQGDIPGHAGGNGGSFREPEVAGIEEGEFRRLIEDTHMFVFGVALAAEAEPGILGGLLDEVFGLEGKEFLGAHQVGVEGADAGNEEFAPELPEISSVAGGRVTDVIGGDTEGFGRQEGRERK